MPESNPLTPDLARLADVWWLERKAEPHGSEAWYALQMLARTRPADAWQVFLALVQRLTGAPAPLTREDQLHGAVASVLGDVLEADASAFAERVERTVAANPVVRHLLGRLTLPDDAAPRATLERLKAASGGRLRIAPAPGSALGKVAFEVADEYRAGTLAAGIPPGEQFPVPYLAAEIARRLPGRPLEDYVVAAECGLHWSR